MHSIHNPCLHRHHSIRGSYWEKVARTGLPIQPPPLDYHPCNSGFMHGINYSMAWLRRAHLPCSRRELNAHPIYGDKFLCGVNPTEGPPLTIEVWAWSKRNARLKAARLFNTKINKVFVKEIKETQNDNQPNSGTARNH